MTAIHNDHSVFAQRYAGAYLDSLEGKNFPAASKEITAFVSLLDQSPELKSVIENPLFSVDDKKAVLNTLSEQAKFTDIFLNFLLTILKNGRLQYLESILRAAQSEFSRREGAVNAFVETAYPLDSAQEKSISEKIGKMTGGKAQMTVNVNPDLIGGIVITLGSQRFDGSVKRRLELLAQDMREGANEYADITSENLKKA